MSGNFSSPALEAVKVAISLRDQTVALKYLATAFSITGNATIAKQLADIAGEIDIKIGQIRDNIDEQLRQDRNFSSDLLSAVTCVAVKTLSKK